MHCTTVLPSFTGTILGEEAHGARPELGINAIEGAAFVEGLQKIWTDPNVSASVKMTQFNAGGISTNIIPGKQHLASMHEHKQMK